MKLVFITPGMTFGGAERVISILSNIWCDMGHDVSIFIQINLLLIGQMRK